MKSKSGNKKLWIAVIIFVLMIAGAIGNHSDNKDGKPDSESSVATESQAATETETNINTESAGDTEDFVTEGVISNTYKTDSSSAGQMQVHFIDVGQGDATLIACDGHYMLIDAGNNDKGTTVQSYLMSQGVEKLDYVIGTHPDADHIGGLDVVIYKFDCDTIIMPDVANDTRTYDDVVQAMKFKGYQTTYPVVGETYTLGGATFTIVAPNADYGNDMNDWSVGVLVQNGNNRFLFTGDAEEKAEEDILNNGIDISADVYAAAHHGSKTATSQAFLDKVSPTYVVISAGEGNKYGHPHAEVLNRLRAAGISVFRTDEQGTIVATSDGNDITWNCSPSESWKAGEPTGSSDTSQNAASSGTGTSNNNSSSSVADNSTADSTTSSGSSDAGIAADTSGSTNSDSSSVMVHITDTGSKYHSAGCSYLKKSDHEVALSEAKSMGLTPCSRCNPPQ